MRRHWLVAVIALQVAVPAVVTLHGVPGRFGFHMYSGQERLEVHAVDQRGREVPVDVAGLVAKVRYELDWTVTLPRHICGSDPRIAKVHVVSSDRRATVAC